MVGHALDGQMHEHTYLETCCETCLVGHLCIVWSGIKLVVTDIGLCLY